MAMTTAYLNLIADAADAITHVGLVNGSGTELSGGGYGRQAVTWTAPSSGLVRPTGNLVFTVGAGSTVAGWRGYSASTAGTDYGGETLTTETFGSAGTYTLLAASTGVQHTAV